MREDVIPSKGGRAGGARDLASCGDAQLIAEVSSGLMEKHYYVYILTNAGGTVLYVGITNDLPSRVDRHAAGLGGAFTKNYRLARLLLFETYGDARRAIAREKEIKGWRRSKKEALIRTMNPKLENLRLKMRSAP